jgi:nitrogen fixation/metabolism regulation signal transduction histidine kinase
VVLLGLGLLWFRSGYSLKVQWTFSVLAVLAWLVGALAIERYVARSLQTISNLLACLREGDFSVRGRGAAPGDALGEALIEVNSLATTLAQERTDALEASALLSKVMAEIDVAIFAFDGCRKLKLLNRVGEKLLGLPASQAMDQSASSLGMEAFLEGSSPRTVEASFHGLQESSTRLWELRRRTFRQGGLPHELLVLTDLQRALREEERQAWQRLVRVLGHEINNSLAPIRSIADDLQQTLARPATERMGDWQEDVARGLAVIERRAGALGRFMSSYASLAKLPPPRRAPIDVGRWVRRVLELEQRLPIVLSPGPDVAIMGDGDQLDQLLINLVRNAVEAASETGGGVEVSWRKLPHQIEVRVADGGPGVANTDNLFVPFFTTKPTGSGIGLALSRQIAEAHWGALTLEARTDRSGAVARLRLPL